MAWDMRLIDVHGRILPVLVVFGNWEGKTCTSLQSIQLFTSRERLGLVQGLEYCFLRGAVGRPFMPSHVSLCILLLFGQRLMSSDLARTHAFVRKTKIPPIYRRLNESVVFSASCGPKGSERVTRTL